MFRRSLVMNTDLVICTVFEGVISHESESPRERMGFVHQMVQVKELKRPASEHKLGTVTFFAGVL